MFDIVVWLRDIGGDSGDSRFLDAADEIERLCTEVITPEQRAVLDAAPAWWYDPDDLNDPFAIDAGEVEAGTADRLFRAIHAWMQANPDDPAVDALRAATPKESTPK
jgi:hypothetical protein